MLFGHHTRRDGGCRCGVGAIRGLPVGSVLLVPGHPCVGDTSVGIPGNGESALPGVLFEGRFPFSSSVAIDYFVNVNHAFPLASPVPHSDSNTTSIMVAITIASNHAPIGSCRVVAVGL